VAVAQVQLVATDQRALIMPVAQAVLVQHLTHLGD
jgi:hypothetical protein